MRWLDQRKQREEKADLRVQAGWQNLRIVLRHPIGGGHADASFYYVNVWNQGIKTAEDVVPYVVIDHPDWKSAGLMRLLVVPRPAYHFYLIDCPESKDTDVDRFALAVIDNAKTESMTLPGKGLPETFALIVGVNNAGEFRVPTAGPLPAFVTYPSKCKIDLYLQIKDMPYIHAQTYEIDATIPSKMKVVPKYA